MIRFVKREFVLLETTAKRIDEVCEGLGIEEYTFVNRLVEKHMPLDSLDALQKIVEDIGTRTYMLDYEEKRKVYELVISYLRDKIK